MTSYRKLIPTRIANRFANMLKLFRMFGYVLLPDQNCKIAVHGYGFYRTSLLLPLYQKQNLFAGLPISRTPFVREAGRSERAQRLTRGLCRPTHAPSCTT